jgi:hypothetical protein
VVRLVALALALAPGCCWRSVPRAQAAEDLGCPAAEVRIRHGVHTQLAEGCGRSVIYEEVCEGKECYFAARRSLADRAPAFYFFASSMP